MYQKLLIEDYLFFTLHFIAMDEERRYKIDFTYLLKIKNEFGLPRSNTKNSNGMIV